MAIIGNIAEIRARFFQNKLCVVFDYLENALDVKTDTGERLRNLQSGAFNKVEIGSNIFALEQAFYTKERNDCFFESHRKYIDFQLLIEGEEQMELSHRSRLKEEKPYDEKSDLITYEFANQASKIIMKQGDLAIYFPEDIHMGLGKVSDASFVRKTVIKYPIDLWNT